MPVKKARQPAKKKPRSKHIRVPTPQVVETAQPLTTEAPNVADLLRRSRALHTQFHTIDRTAVPGKQAAMKAALVEALALRDEATAADPDHADLSWLEDAVPSDQIRTFFSTFIGRH